MQSLTQIPVWQDLLRHRQAFDKIHMRDLFETDDSRAEKLSLQFGEILLDYSKNLVTDESLKLLMQLARDCGVEQLRDRMFAGDAINLTEQRAVLHTALRNRSNQKISVGDVDVMPAVNAVLEKMRAFSDSVRDGDFTGYTDKRMTDIVNIGSAVQISARQWFAKL